MVVLFWAGGRSLFVPGLAETDLLQNANKKFVHVVLDAAGGFYEFAVAGYCQSFAICAGKNSFNIVAASEKNFLIKISDVSYYFIYLFYLNLFKEVYKEQLFRCLLYSYTTELIIFNESIIYPHKKYFIHEHYLHELILAQTASHTYS